MSCPRRYVVKKIAWILMFVLLFSTTVFANSAEPPKLGILVKNAPKDLKVYLQGENLSDSRQGWETYFFVYKREIPEDLSGLQLEFISQEKSFTVDLPETAWQNYNSKVTVDFRTEKLSLGLSIWRKIALIALRMTLTFLIEGLVFYLFGFRDKRSWIIFVMVNLITQGFLNLVLSENLIPSHIFIGFILLELIIFIVEMILFTVAVKEKKWWNRLIYAFTANFASAFIGAHVILFLPL